MESRSDSLSQDGACAEHLAGAAARFEVVLINPYELGRQPFALAEPAAWLKRDGFEVRCIDLSLQQLEPALLAAARIPCDYGV